jgi:hypothetical protein
VKGARLAAEKKLRQHGASLRLALNLVNLSRATFYRQSRGHPQENGLREQISELAHAQASFGYRRITAVLRRQGWQVNLRRVYRLYRQIELQKPVSKKSSRPSAGGFQAETKAFGRVDLVRFDRTWTVRGAADCRPPGACGPLCWWMVLRPVYLAVGCFR